MGAVKLPGRRSEALANSRKESKNMTKNQTTKKPYAERVAEEIIKALETDLPKWRKSGAKLVAGSGSECSAESRRHQNGRTATRCRLRRARGQRTRSIYPLYGKPFLIAETPPRAAYTGDRPPRY